VEPRAGLDAVAEKVSQLLAGIEPNIQVAVLWFATLCIILLANVYLAL